MCHSSNNKLAYSLVFTKGIGKHGSTRALINGGEKMSAFIMGELGEIITRSAFATRSCIALNNILAHHHTKSNAMEILFLKLGCH